LSSHPDPARSGDPQRDQGALPADRPLTIPLLIRGSYDHPLFVALWVIVAIFFGLGLYGLAKHRDWDGALVCWSLAAVVAVPSTVFGLWLKQQRRWLEVTLTGFVISRRDQRRVYGDDQVVGVAQSARIDAEGNSKRRVVLEVGGNEGNERIECRYFVPNGQTDPLTAILERVQQRLARRTAEGLAGGAQLRGAGWFLDRQGLHRGGSVYRLEEISWVGFFGRRLSLWRGNEERPFLRLSLDARNVHVLGLVLCQLISQRPGYDQPPPGLPLGRLLLERREWAATVAVPVVTIAATGVAALSVYGVLVRAGAVRHPIPLVVMGGLLLAILGLSFLQGWLGWGNRVRFYERGVTQPRRRGEKRLLYEDLGEVTWKRDYVLILRPLPGRGLPPIWFRAFARKFDLGLVSMRDHLCRVLAQRWAAQLPHGPVPWTSRLRFLPGGLEYHPWKLLGASEPVTVPYHLFTGFRLEPLNCLLLVAGPNQPVCKERHDLPNFFVGLMLFTWIYRSQQQLPGAGEAAPRAFLPGSATARDERIRGLEHPPENVTLPPEASGQA
jgi:hypothetical protein